MSKELFGEASQIRNKKQEATRKKKIEQEKLEGKSLDIRDGDLDDIPPLPRGGGWGDNYSAPPSLHPRKYQVLVFCLVRCES